MWRWLPGGSRAIHRKSFPVATIVGRRHWVDIGQRTWPPPQPRDLHESADVTSQQGAFITSTFTWRPWLAHLLKFEVHSVTSPRTWPLPYEFAFAGKKSMRYMGRRHQNNYWPLQFGTWVWHLLIGSLRWSVVVGHQPPKKPILPKNGSVETPTLPDRLRRVLSSLPITCRGWPWIACESVHSGRSLRLTIFKKSQICDLSRRLMGERRKKDGFTYLCGQGQCLVLRFGDRFHRTLPVFFWALWDQKYEVATPKSAPWDQHQWTSESQERRGNLVWVKKPSQDIILSPCAHLWLNGTRGLSTQRFALSNTLERLVA